MSAFQSFANIFSVPDLRKRVIFTFLLLAVYRLGSHIPTPGVDPAAINAFFKSSAGSLFGFLDIFSGGALRRLSVFALGIMPYISASIILQLLTVVWPYLEKLSKEGEMGRKKITQYTRYGTVLLSFIQASGIALWLEKQIAPGGARLVPHPGWGFRLMTILTLTTGTIFIMWLGEQITERGIGNGISLIIFCGIVSRLPTSAGQFASLASGDAGKIITLIGFLIATLAVIAFVVLLNEGQRNIPVSYAKRTRGDRVYAGVDTHLPLRVITAGVIPIIFALAFLSVPGLLGQLLTNAKTHWVAQFASHLTTWFSPNGAVYAVSYFVLVVAFTYFYTSVVFNPKDIAENLQKQGGFIPGIRPGNQTAVYLRKVVNRITLAGAVGLGVIAVLPFIAQSFTNSQTLTFGGTGLLIVVSVAIETLKQIEAQAITTSYEQY